MLKLAAATVFVVLSLAGWLPGDAHAAFPANLTRAVAVADAHWPSSPCHGREHLVTTAPEVMDAVTGTTTAYAAAFATRDPCDVRVVWSRIAPLPWWMRCKVFAHEFGHLANHWHINNPVSLMYPYLNGANQNAMDCYRAFPPTALEVMQWSL